MAKNSLASVDIDEHQQRCRIGWGIGKGKKYFIFRYFGIAEHQPLNHGVTFIVFRFNKASTVSITNLKMLHDIFCLKTLCIASALC